MWNSNPYYQPYYNQPMSQPMQDNLAQLRGQQTPNTDERLWVQGEDAAKAYLVAPNAFVRLWDSQKNVFYEKRADNIGRPYMETFEYSRKSSEEPNKAVDNEKQTSIYDDRFKAIEERLKALEEVLVNDVEQ